MAAKGEAKSGLLAIVATTLRATGRWARRLAIVGMFAISLLSVGLTAAMAVSSAVFNVVSGVVEVVYDGATVRRHRNAELTQMRKQLDDEVASSKRLRRDLAETVADRDRMRKELAKRTVTYRGSKRLAREPSPIRAIGWRAGSPPAQGGIWRPRPARLCRWSGWASSLPRPPTNCMTLAR